MSILEIIIYVLIGGALTTWLAYQLFIKKKHKKQKENKQKPNNKTDEQD